MSDGWSDKKGRHLINFLVNSPEGTFFLKSVDVSSEIQDAVMLAKLFEEQIDEIGRDTVCSGNYIISLFLTSSLSILFRKYSH